MDEMTAKEQERQDAVWQQEMERLQAKAGHMQIVAEVLHVGMKELFCLENVPQQVFFLWEDGLHALPLEEGMTKETCEELPWSERLSRSVVDTEHLTGLLNGSLRIKWEPFLPAEPDFYYYLSDTGEVKGTNWHGTFADYAHFATGNCFQTKEQVKRCFAQMFAKLKQSYQAARGIPEEEPAAAKDELTLFDT